MAQKFVAAMPTMPCGHPSKLLSGLVFVCAFDCDVRRVDAKPRCDKCGSTDLVKHRFGNDVPNSAWYNQQLPNAARCQTCKNVMHYGGI